MHGKPSQELNPIEGNGLFDGPLAVIFGNESNFTIGNVQNTLVGNGYPVGVLPQVFNHMIGTCQGGFAMHYPPGIVCLLQLIVEQRQLVLLSQDTFQAIEELSFKGIAQLMNRVKVFALMSDVFPPAIKGITGPRDNAMDMRVQTQVLPPAMKYTNGPAFNAVMRVTE